MPGTIFQAPFFLEIFDKYFLWVICYINYANFITRLCYSVKYVSCFMPGYLMTSQHLNIWKVKIWLSQERKELSKWNKKTFFLLSQVLLFRHTIQISKNVADTTFKEFKKFKLKDFSSISPVLLHTQYWDVYVILVPWFLTDCTENEH